MLSKRKPNRLVWHNYSDPGCYYITICTKDRQKFFWNESVPKELSEIGAVAKEKIELIESIYDGVVLVKYCIMPDHIHMIIFIPEYSSEEKRMYLSRIVKQLKGAITKEAGQGISLWQRSYYDEIIRDKETFDNVCRYIENNPEHYLNDDVFSDNKSADYCI